MRKAADIEEKIVLVVNQNESKLSVEPTATLSQAQKYRRLLQTCQLIASIGSEGGMATFEVSFLKIVTI